MEVTAVRAALEPYGKYLARGAKALGKAVASSNILTATRYLMRAPRH